MKHLKLNNGSVVYPYTTLRSDHPDTSFPKPLTDDVLAQFGVFPVAETPRPEAEWHQEVQEVTPVLDGAVWRQAWEVLARPTAEVDAIIEAEWVRLRATRDALLAACDWTQLPDSPVNRATWAVYRQALRDVPMNTTFPHKVVWPDKPA